MVSKQQHTRRATARRFAAWQILVAASSLLLSCASGAFEFALPSAGLSGALNMQLSLGATLRNQDHSSKLVGKLNLPGQENFCEDKPLLPPGAAPGINCTTVEGNAAYLALPGYAGVNNDNGNLNYERGEIVNAAVRFAPRLQLTHEYFGIDIGAVAFYDPVNDDRDDYHPSNIEDNNGFQPRYTPRSREVRGAVGHDVTLLDAYLSTHLPLPGERELQLKIGNQLLALGTSTLLTLNSLNTVNPPDTNRLFVPGSDVRDVFRRVPLLSFGTSLTESVAVQGFYQFVWEPAEIPAVGTYYSTNDAVGIGGYYNVVLFGKSREDPDNVAGVEERTPGNASLLSNAGRTLFRGQDREPSNGGQYGVSFNYLADWLDNTSFDFTYLRLHSRLPVASFIAAQKGCSSDAQNSAEALVACEGFSLSPAGTEVLPIDTVSYFYDYPEGIQSFGFSFAASLGEVAWTGELVYRPSQPLQVDVLDLGFAALQPVFPASTLDFGVTAIPGRRVATPDYVETRYRGNTQVQPGQFIRGYENFRTLTYNTSFVVLRGASDNPFGADQVTSLLEIGAYQILGLPSHDELQLGAPGIVFHRSAGIDGTGDVSEEQATVAADKRINPSSQRSGFGEDFSWGYRWLLQLAYEDVLPGMRLAPQFTFFHDVNGTAPLPSGEFIQGRRQASTGLNLGYGNSLNFNLRYTWFTGGGSANLLGDRDNLQFNVSYDF